MLLLVVADDDGGVDAVDLVAAQHRGAAHGLGFHPLLQGVVEEGDVPEEALGPPGRRLAAVVGHGRRRDVRRAVRLEAGAVEVGLHLRAAALAAALERLVGGVVHAALRLELVGGGPRGV